MRLFGIREGNSHSTMARVESVRAACAIRNIEYVDIAADTFVFSDVRNLNGTDIVYRLTRGAHAIETYFISYGLVSTWDEHVRMNINIIDTTTAWSILHDVEGLQSPKTVHFVTNNRHQLLSAAEYVGGYPLIMKVAGGSLGLGVIKIDSQESLFSTADFVSSTEKPFIIREFISDARDVRAIVVGDRVVKVYGYETIPGDFRSNATAHVRRRPDHLSDAAQRDAIKAVQLISASVGGVDFRVKATGEHYLLEVNLPFGFGVTGDDGDVSLAIVDHFISKAEKRENQFRS